MLWGVGVRERGAAVALAALPDCSWNCAFTRHTVCSVSKTRWCD